MLSASSQTKDPATGIVLLNGPSLNHKKCCTGQSVKTQVCLSSSVWLYIGGSTLQVQQMFLNQFSSSYGRSHDTIHFWWTPLLPRCLLHLTAPQLKLFLQVLHSVCLFSLHIFHWIFFVFSCSPRICSSKASKATLEAAGQSQCAREVMLYESFIPSSLLHKLDTQTIPKWMSKMFKPADCEIPHS